MIRCVAIVDAYSSASLLAHYLKQENVRVVHIQSQRVIPNIYKKSFRPTDFEAHIVFTGELASTIDSLKSLQVDAILAGIESGVELADQLNEAMGLPGNGTALSEARRDKYKMVQTIAAAGLNHIPTLLTRDPLEATRWSAEKFPVVCKPVKSAGTDNVIICETANEIERAFARILDSVNCLGLLNESVLVQKFIEGTEFIVDLIACQDQYRLVAVEQYKKIMNRGSMIYDTVHFLDFADPRTQVLTDYTKEVSRALGIQHGPIHAEVILNESGPVLVEIAARQDGGGAHPFQQAALGTSQVVETVEALLHPEQYLKRGPYQIKQQVLRIDLISDTQGTSAGFRYEKEIRSLESFLKFESLINQGEPIVPTDSLFTVPAFVDLAHSDPNVVRRDYEQIRHWEKLGMYRTSEKDTLAPLSGEPALESTASPVKEEPPAIQGQ